jgi:hypothetical protein
VNTVGHKMNADNAVEDAGEVGKVVGGVTFEWLRQVRKGPGVNFMEGYRWSLFLILIKMVEIPCWLARWWNWVLIVLQDKCCLFITHT